MNTEFPRLGESRTEEGYRLRPFTGIAVMLLAVTVTAGLVAVFVFADTPEDRWTFGLLSLAADVLAALIFAAVVRREERAPFPLAARKVVWLSVVLLAIGATAVCIYALFAPLRGFRPGVALSALIPAAMITWKLFRREKG